MFYEDIAEICHAVHLAYCSSLGDDSIPIWDDLPEEHQELLIDGVEYIAKYPETTPELSHAHWCKTMTKMGWVYGVYKNATKKEHPNLVNFGRLTEREQSKDYIFVSLVKQLIDV